jgi:hypothetical protein
VDAGVAEDAAGITPAANVEHRKAVRTSPSVKARTEAVRGAMKGAVRIAAGIEVNAEMGTVAAKTVKVTRGVREQITVKGARDVPKEAEKTVVKTETEIVARVTAEVVATNVETVIVLNNKAEAIKKEPKATRNETPRFEILRGVDCRVVSCDLLPVGHGEYCGRCVAKGLE